MLSVMQCSSSVLFIKSSMITIKGRSNIFNLCRILLHMVKVAQNFNNVHKTVAKHKAKGWVATVFTWGLKNWLSSEEYLKL